MTPIVFTQEEVLLMRMIASGIGSLEVSARANTDILSAKGLTEVFKHWGKSLEGIANKMEALSVRVPGSSL